MEKTVEGAKEGAEGDEQDERFKEDPEARFRIYSVLSYFFVLIVLGLPVWWHTTRVYRAPLPLDEMTNVQLPPKTIRENSIPLSLEYDVLITIVNQDPQNVKVHLKGGDLATNLRPFLATVDAVANFTVKSQWLYMVELGVALKNRGDHLALSEEQLPHVITPLEKKIWSHMSPRPSLNLVVYVTRCDSPVLLYDVHGKPVTSNAFLSPRWGGVLVLNPSTSGCSAREYKPNLQHVIAVFATQLRELLGLKGPTAEDVALLKKVKTKEMVGSTRRTLKSLAQLLMEINSIVISDEVARKVGTALSNADAADKFAAEGRVEEALRAAKEAYRNSEEAFSDPSLLALLYFPDDQKYAVYIPLFLPIMIPVLMSLHSVHKFYKQSPAKRLKQD